ncbi:RNA-binding protein NOB1 [Gracilaria domingensis]|nr:RNA-binding protein NOB1 [Gracilaria domingensis]
MASCDDENESLSGGEWETVRTPRSKTVGGSPKKKRADFESKHRNGQGNEKSSRQRKTLAFEDVGVETKEDLKRKEEVPTKEIVKTKKEMETEKIVNTEHGTKTKEVKLMKVETKDVSQQKSDEHVNFVSDKKTSDQQVGSKSPRRRSRPRRRRRKVPEVEQEQRLATDGNVQVMDGEGQAHHEAENESCSLEKTSNSAAVVAEKNWIQSCSDETEDSDEDGSEWINELNLEEHLARDRGEEMDSVTERSRVVCVTTDFAMQNTMLQMGLKLLSVDGRRSIRNIKHFALRCHACGVVTTELERKFCDKCGNSSMHRVAYKIDKNGLARAFLNPKKKASLRGTKYPIPMPRGGRHNNDLILREDQIDPVKQRRLEKQRERLNVDVLDPSNFYNAGARFNPHYKPLVVGYGRRNPNEVRGNSRGKR